MRRLQRLSGGAAVRHGGEFSAQTDTSAVPVDGRRRRQKQASGASDGPDLDPELLGCRRKLGG